MTVRPVSWPVLDQEMKRFLSFKKQSKADYMYPTTGELQEPGKTRRFWQKFSCEEVRALEENALSDLEAVMEKERSYNRLLSAQLEKLEIEREAELVERHLLAVIEENRSVLNERENLRRKIVRECRASKANLDELSKRGKLRRDDDEDEEWEPEEESEDANQSSHAHNSLLEEFYGSEEDAREQLQKFEKEIMNNINSSKSDKDLKRVKSTITAKQSVLLYALSLVEVLRTSETYPGLNQSDEENEDAEKKTPTKDRKRKERYLLEPRLIPSNMRRTVKKPDSLFTWNPRIAENWDNSTTTEVEIFRPVFDGLETEV